PGQEHHLHKTAVADIVDVVAHGMSPGSELKSAAIIARLWTDRKTQASASRTVRWRMKSIVSGYRCFVSRPSNAPVCSRIYRIASEDRKSTRLNSSHVKISYAVFCLKK